MRQYYPLMPANGEQGPPDKEQGPPGPPDYKVYRSRPGLLSRLRAPDLATLRERLRGKGPVGPAPPGTDRKPGERAAPKERPERPLSRRVLIWVGIVALAWLALSLLAFAVSSQIQKGKLADMGDTLGGNPFMLGFPQTILVLGTDVRPSGLAATGEDTPDRCIEAAGQGETPPSTCSPYRADTIMLVRAGRFAFRKLSIPRDTFAAIPGQEAQKINAAYAFGGAKLEVQTVEQFLGIDVDQVAVVDFNGFRDFIDAIGGVTVEIDQKVCSEISGGAENGGFSLFLNPGEHDLNADQALSLTRTRSNLPADPQGNPCPPIDDLDRAQFQQDVLSGIKGRMTSITRLPYNFIKGPLIGWNAPKAFVSSMGMLNMPQFVLSAALGFSSKSEVLEPSTAGPFGSIAASQEECARAVRQFLGHDPPRTPGCSPAS
jgi:LCP family protein required for cell wall assembly